jgi:hypothetical protein
MGATARRGPESNGHASTAGKLVLYVADPPSAVDQEVAQAVREFDSSVEIVALGEKPQVSTPRLDAIEYNMSVYRGVESILSFIKMERRRREELHE